ncbi:MAG: hemerythrin family protein [Rhodospirillales bacterium]|nr:hemerythrin family protein [Rhodospirillales bacterium]
MRPIAWSAKYACNIRPIDDDHRALFETAETLRLRHESGAGPELILACIDALLMYAHDHFDREELFMQRGGYPDLESHRRDHEKFRSLIRALKELYTYTPEIIDIGKVLTYLEGWLAGHILIKDSQFVNFIMKKDPLMVREMEPDLIGKGVKELTTKEIKIHPSMEQALHDAVRILNSGGPLAIGLQRGIQKLIDQGDAEVLAEARKLFM